MKKYKLLIVCVLVFFFHAQINAQVDKVENKTVQRQELFVNKAILSQANSITNVRISNSSPACLANGDQVNVEFEYKHNNAGGVRIFVRPMSKGNLTPDYAAHASPLYKEKQGSGEGNFTISSGKVFVDQIRIQMVSKSGDVILNHYEDVQFIFTGENGAEQSNTEIPQGDVHVIDKSILPDGKVQISYSDNSKKLLYKGGFARIDPQGKMQTFSMMGVQPNTPPGLPGDSDIVAWLEDMNAKLLNSINVLVGMDEDIVNHYLEKENEETDDLYGQINLRMTYIDFLISE